MFENTWQSIIKIGLCFPYMTIYEPYNQSDRYGEAWWSILATHLQNYDNLILASWSNTTPTFLESEQVYPHPYLGVYLSLSNLFFKCGLFFTLIFHTIWSVMFQTTLYRPSYWCWWTCSSTYIYLLVQKLNPRT